MKPRSGLAVIALTLGLLTFPTLGVTGIPAIVCGLLGMRDAHARRVGGTGSAIVGIALGLWALRLFDRSVR